MLQVRYTKVPFLHASGPPARLRSLDARRSIEEEWKDGRKWKKGREWEEKRWGDWRGGEIGEMEEVEGMGGRD